MYTKFDDYNFNRFRVMIGAQKINRSRDLTMPFSGVVRDP